MVLSPSYSTINVYMIAVLYTVKTGVSQLHTKGVFRPLLRFYTLKCVD